MLSFGMARFESARQPFVTCGNRPQAASRRALEILAAARL
jgi:hypothetical protein